MHEARRNPLLAFRAYVRATRQRPRTGRKLMKLHKRHAIVLVAVLAALAVVSYAVAAGGSGKFDESLSGYRRILRTSRPPGTAPSRPSSRRTAPRSATGCRIQISKGPPPQAHIHLGQKLVNGGISVFLCTQPRQRARRAPKLCPPAPATITGTITAANVIGPAGQGIPAGAVRRARPGDEGGRHLRERPHEHGPGGEIRAQLRDNEGNDD